MELRPNLKDGCRAGSIREPRLSFEQHGSFLMADIHTVAGTKGIDYRVIKTIACEIGHRLSFLSVSLSSFGLGMAKAFSFQRAGKAVSCRGLKHAELIHTGAVSNVNCARLRRSGLATVPAGETAKTGLGAEAPQWLSR